MNFSLPPIVNIDICISIQCSEIAYMMLKMIILYFFSFANFIDNGTLLWNIESLYLVCLYQEEKSIFTDYLQMQWRNKKKLNNLIDFLCIVLHTFAIISFLTDVNEENSVLRRNDIDFKSRTLILTNLIE